MTQNTSPNKKLYEAVAYLLRVAAPAIAEIEERANALGPCNDTHGDSLHERGTCSCYTVNAQENLSSAVANIANIAMNMVAKEGRKEGGAQ